MKRDMDLIRRIALETVELPYGEALTGLEDVDAATFGVHVMWMQEAGLVDAAIDEFMTNEPPAVAVHRLTWAGCEFADAVANDTLWAKAKKDILKPSASWTFGLLTDWLKAEIAQGLPAIRAAIQ